MGFSWENSRILSTTDLGNSQRRDASLPQKITAWKMLEVSLGSCTWSMVFPWFKLEKMVVLRASPANISHGPCTLQGTRKHSPPWEKGKSSTQQCQTGWDMLVSSRVYTSKQPPFGQWKGRLEEAGTPKSMFTPYNANVKFSSYMYSTSIEI